MLIHLMGILGLGLVLGLLAYAHLKKQSFSRRVFLALVLGGLLGAGLHGLVHHWEQPFSFEKNLLRLLGQGYLSFLKMLVAPLVLTALIHAVLQLGEGKEGVLGKIALKSIACLLGLTALASAIGMAVGLWLKVGAGMSLPAVLMTPEHAYTGWVETLLGMLPSNPVQMMLNDNTVAMVIFAILLGAAALLMGGTEPEQLRRFKAAVEVLFSLVKKLASLVIMMTPYGVLALIALVVMDQGGASLSGLAVFLGAMYLAMAGVLVLHSLLLLLVGESPLSYYRFAYVPLLVAFTTRSSFGTLPVTAETLFKKFKIREATSTMVPSFGATLGMNACAGVFPAMLVVMALTLTHHAMTPEIFILVMALNALASLGISGIPGTAFIAATVTLTTLGLPFGVVALVQGIDPIIDMGRTAVNVNGTLTSALLADRLTKSG